MRRVLLAIFLMAGIISASAFESAPARPVSTSLAPEAVAAVKLQTDVPYNRINSSYRSELPQAAAPNLVNSQPDKADSGWQYLGTLLTTLALIATIAIRRHMAGKR